MTARRSDEEVIQAWHAHRSYLIDLAFRMLGDIGAAEDVVQDAFSRLLRTTPGEIDDARGWLIVVTSGLCLDQIRSARARRERTHDASEIEYTGGEALTDRDTLADPADRVTLDNTVRLALLVVLQRLSPAERVVFVLHDIFAVPFGSIAQTVGRGGQLPPAGPAGPAEDRGRPRRRQLRRGRRRAPEGHREVHRRLRPRRPGRPDRGAGPRRLGRLRRWPGRPPRPRRDPRRGPGGPAPAVLLGTAAPPWSPTRCPASPSCLVSTAGNWAGSWS